MSITYFAALIGLCDKPQEHASIPIGKVNPVRGSAIRRKPVAENVGSGLYVLIRLKVQTGLRIPARVDGCSR